MTLANGLHLRLEDVPDRMRLSDITAARDSHKLYEQLRDEWGPVAPMDLEPGVPAWLVLGYDEASSVMRNELLFSRSSRNWRYVREHSLRAESGVFAALSPRENAYYLDGMQQRRLRAPLVDALSGVDEKRLARTVSVTCKAIIDRLMPRGEADLVSEYAVSVPVLVMTEMFGMSLSDGNKMHELTEALYAGTENAIAAATEQEALLAALVARRRAEPGDDLITALVHHPNHRNDAEVMASLGVMFGLGHNAEIAWIASTLHMILTDPAFASRVRRGRLDLDDALDEVSRRNPPTPHVLPRFALQDCELGGRRIALGDALVPAVAAANSDRAIRTDDPWEELGSRFQLTWGAGAHACPAHRIGPLIGRIAVDTLLRRILDMELIVSSDSIKMSVSSWSRYPRSLPVRFTSPPMDGWAVPSADHLRR
ncbi:Cytochrome P450 [Promicromonospora umidemergens]|uniref:Cytochrome P450 n=1 Tax=Promicromonospora umidemergens TaxID=629679 RepID=A0ABP8YCE9_9MICO|nr:cytochrome P450 [Promicromonospora umidemergens]MCP2286467.1 Cytochrome P450 [Promicromonospora umidemergens]